MKEETKEVKTAEQGEAEASRSTAVRRSFEGVDNIKLDEICKNLRTTMEDQIYNIQNEINNQFENALKTYCGDDKEYIKYLAHSKRGEIKEVVPNGLDAFSRVKEFWLDDKKVFSVVVVMKENTVTVTTTWHHLKGEQLSPQNFA